MRNKGAIWTLAIALVLVCLYQLSFTFVTYKVRKDSKTYAQDPQKGVDQKKADYFQFPLCLLERLSLSLRKKPRRRHKK